MRLRRLVAVLAFLIALPGFAATPASFRGKVIELPKAKNGLLLIMSRNGKLRRVIVNGARVVYAPTVPQTLRKPQAAQALHHGAEVRVTAEENGAGLWHARLVEILNPAGAPTKKEPAVPKGPAPPQPLLSRRTT